MSNGINNKIKGGGGRREGTAIRLFLYNEINLLKYTLELIAHRITAYSWVAALPQEKPLNAQSDQSVVSKEDLEA